MMLCCVGVVFNALGDVVGLVSALRIGSDNSDEVVHFAPWNKAIEFRSAGPLNLSPSWMIRSCGFATSDEAREAADQLWQALLLAGVKNVRGVSLEEVEVGPDSALLVLGTKPHFSI